MGPVINVDMLGGTAEVAECLGCPKQQVHALRRNPLFPQPIKHLAATPLWDLAAVQAFKASWARRPRKAATPDQVTVSAPEAL